MIKIDDYDILCDNKMTLKELSKDDSDNENIEYVTDSMLVATNFDLVKRLYTNSLGLSEEVVSSADALVETNDSIALIEFKNGTVVNREIKDKARDSLLILCDIIEKEISYTRKYLDFVLVYNESKNPLPNQYTKGVVRDSSSRLNISKYFLQKGKEEIVLYDLNRYKGIYFREIHTYTQEEFEEYLKSNFAS